MPALYDIESYVTDVVELYESELNTYIACMNTNKNDSITLPDVNNYYLEPILHFGITVSEPFFSYGFVDKLISQEIASVAPTEITMVFRIGFIQNDIQTDLTVLKMLLRYQQVLINVLNQNFNKFAGYGKPAVSAAAPTICELEGNVVRSAEIEVTFILG